MYKCNIVRKCLEGLFHYGHDNRLLRKFPFQRPLPLVRILAVPVAFRAVLHHVPRGVVNIFHLSRYKRQGKEVGESNSKAYYASAMEMEAKENRDNMDYLRTRPFGAFFRYYGKI